MSAAYDARIRAWETRLNRYSPSEINLLFNRLVLSAPELLECPRCAKGTISQRDKITLLAQSWAAEEGR